MNLSNFFSFFFFCFLSTLTLFFFWQIHVSEVHYLPTCTAVLSKKKQPQLVFDIQEIDTLKRQLWTGIGCCRTCAFSNGYRTRRTELYVHFHVLLFAFCIQKLIQSVLCNLCKVLKATDLIRNAQGTGLNGNCFRHLLRNVLNDEDFRCVRTNSGSLGSKSEVTWTDGSWTGTRCATIRHYMQK